jgi:hypothetical protein
MKTEAPETATDNTSSKQGILHMATQDLIPDTATATFIIRHLTSFKLNFQQQQKLIL